MQVYFGLQLKDKQLRPISKSKMVQMYEACLLQTIMIDQINTEYTMIKTEEQDQKLKA